MHDTILIMDVKFQRTTMCAVREHHATKMLFFMISQSGAIDRRGRIYFFTDDGSAFFMEKEDYDEGFRDELFIFASDWNLVNAYFCDFLVFRPDIYDSFVRELCTRNLPYFWFDTAIEVYGNKYCE